MLPAAVAELCAGLVDVGAVLQTVETAGAVDRASEGFSTLREEMRGAWDAVADRLTLLEGRTATIAEALAEVLAEVRRRPVG